MLERQEHAHVARARVERADERHEQQGPEVREAGEPHAGGEHQQGRTEQQLALAEAMTPGADRERRNRRSEQRRGAQYADGPDVESEREQIRRQQDRDVAIDERTQRTTRHQRACNGISAARGEQVHSANLHRKSVPLGAGQWRWMWWASGTWGCVCRIGA